MKQRILAAGRRAATSAIVLVAGCAVGPAYTPPETSVPAAWTERGAAVTAGDPVARWWTTFGDPVLDRLIERAIQANPQLHEAQARVREARAERAVVAGAELPSIDGRASGSRDRRSDMQAVGPGGTTSTFDARFDAAWEIDVFGGIASEVDAADAALGASIEARRDVLVSLMAEVARNYVELRAAQRQAEIARANLASQRESVDLARTLRDAGSGTDLDVARAESQAAATASTLPAFEITIRRSIHALGVLTGAQPGALSAELAKVAPLLPAPPTIPAGVPSDVLRRRADVRRAERDLAAATARVRVATADLFPRFSLTAAVGLESGHGLDLIDARSRRGSIGGALRWPVFDLDRVRSQIDARSAAEEQALARYEGAVLQSLREVEDALVGVGEERARRAALSESAAAARRAVELATRLWEAGRTDFRAVLDAQRDALIADEALVRADRAATLELVSLYKALGGGWEITEPVAEQPATARADEIGARVVRADR